MNCAIVCYEMDFFVVNYSEVSQVVALVFSELDQSLFIWILQSCNAPSTFV